MTDHECDGARNEHCWFEGALLLVPLPPAGADFQRIRVRLCPWCGVDLFRPEVKAIADVAAATLAKVNEAVGEYFGGRPEPIRKILAAPTGWVQAAALEIAGDPGCCDIQSSDAGRMAEVIDKHRRRH